MNTAITLKEAKARWSSHTRHCLSDSAKAAAKAGKQWRMIGETDPIPVLILGQDQYRLEFFKGPAGVFCKSRKCSCRL